MSEGLEHDAASQRAGSPRLSIVIPTLDDRVELEGALEALAVAIAEATIACEVIVVDGGSVDGTAQWVAGLKEVKLVRSGAGRAKQMNAGVDHARAPWLLFLHGDSRLAPDALAGLEERIAAQNDVLYAFALRFRGTAPFLRTMERGVAWRNRRLNLAYGDQGYCVGRELFERVGGFAEDVPMEDLDFILRLRPYTGVEVLPYELHTSPRQFERQGYLWGAVYNVVRAVAWVALHCLRGGRLMPPPDRESERGTDRRPEGV